MVKKGLRNFSVKFGTFYIFTFLERRPFFSSAYVVLLMQRVKEMNLNMSREANPRHLQCSERFKKRQALSYHCLLPISPPFLANPIHALSTVGRY